MCPCTQRTARLRPQTTERRLRTFESAPLTNVTPYQIPRTIGTGFQCLGHTSVKFFRVISHVRDRRYGAEVRATDVNEESQASLAHERGLRRSADSALLFAKVGSLADKDPLQGALMLLELSDQSEPLWGLRLAARLSQTEAR
jgi:hypothetical protein